MKGIEFTHCLACRGQAWRVPDGEVFCGTCEERAARLAAAFHRARPPVSPRAALLASSGLAR